MQELGELLIAGLGKASDLHLFALARNNILTDGVKKFDYYPPFTLCRAPLDTEKISCVVIHLNRHSTRDRVLVT